MTVVYAVYKQLACRNVECLAVPAENRFSGNDIGYLMAYLSMLRHFIVGTAGEIAELIQLKAAEFQRRLKKGIVYMIPLFVYCHFLHPVV